MLLANDGILPLAAAQLERIAVIGPNAAAPCTQGGGAAHIKAPYAVTPVDGLRAALPASVEIVHEGMQYRITRDSPVEIYERPKPVAWRSP